MKNLLAILICTISFSALAVDRCAIREVDIRIEDEDSDDLNKYVREELTKKGYHFNPVSTDIGSKVASVTFHTEEVTRKGVPILIQMRQEDSFFTRIKNVIAIHRASRKTVTLGYFYGNMTTITYVEKKDDPYSNSIKDGEPYTSLDFTVNEHKSFPKDEYQATDKFVLLQEFLAKIPDCK